MWDRGGVDLTPVQPPAHLARETLPSLASAFPVSHTGLGGPACTMGGSLIRRGHLVSGRPCFWPGVNAPVRASVSPSVNGGVHPFRGHVGRCKRGHRAVSRRWSAEGAALPCSCSILRGLEGWAVPTVAGQPQEAIWRPCLPLLPASLAGSHRKGRPEGPPGL